MTNAPNTFRTTGANANRSTFTGSWGAATYVYNWSLPAFPAGAAFDALYDLAMMPPTENSAPLMW